MKFYTKCLSCAKDLKDVRIDSDLTLSEEDLYKAQCPEGHKLLIELQAFKFELLFESGLRAIDDKYFMESVLSITAAIERFFEFFIRIAVRASNVPAETYEKAFKEISRQSERQIGAFIMLHLVLFKKEPFLLNSKSTEFRNKVVHKGYIPNRDEAILFAQEVYNTIKPTYIELLENYKDGIIKYQLEILNNRRVKYQKILAEHKESVITIVPFLALTHVLTIENFKNQTFLDALELKSKNGIYF